MLILWLLSIVVLLVIIFVVDVNCRNVCQCLCVWGGRRGTVDGRRRVWGGQVVAHGTKLDLFTTPSDMLTCSLVDDA